MAGILFLADDLTDERARHHPPISSAADSRASKGVFILGATTWARSCPSDGAKAALLKCVWDGFEKLPTLRHVGTLLAELSPKVAISGTIKTTDVYTFGIKAGRLVLLPERKRRFYSMESGACVAEGVVEMCKPPAGLLPMDFSHFRNLRYRVGQRETGPSYDEVRARVSISCSHRLHLHLSTSAMECVRARYPRYGLVVSSGLVVTNSATGNNRDLGTSPTLRSTLKGPG